jgi:hypothetical protein
MTVAMTTETIDWATRITEKIQATIVSAREQLRVVEDLLREAQEGNAAEILGYKSWTEYVSHIFSQTPLRLEREDRIEVAKVLSRYGMSTRAIAPIIGSSNATVSRDINEDGSPVTDVTPEEGNPPATVTGLDGKAYSRPEVQPEPPAEKPVKVRRTALTKAAREAASTITAGLDLIESIMADDRYKAGSNAESVRSELRPIITRADDVFGSLESEAEDDSESA